MGMLYRIYRKFPVVVVLKKGKPNLQQTLQEAERKGREKPLPQPLPQDSPYLIGRETPYPLKIRVKAILTVMVL